MKDILQEIVANKRSEILAGYHCPEYKKAVWKMAEQVKRRCLPLSDVIKGKNRAGLPGIIAEFKRRSPSKGDIAPGADVAPVVRIYKEGGAAGCSVLTDTRYFGGALTDLSLARDIVDMPLLRKDFIIDEIQICEAYLAGADLVLLIASVLSKDRIEDYTHCAHQFGMEVLLEIHDEKEIEKIIPEADLIGVNNRALASFHTDVNHSASLIDKLPKNAVKIAESGIKTKEDITRLMDVGYNGFLIGETFMKSGSPLATLKEFCNVG